VDATDKRRKSQEVASSMTPGKTKQDNL